MHIKYTYNQINISIFLFKNHAENEAGRLVLDFFFFAFENGLTGKSKWSAALFQYISIAYNKNKLHKILDYLSIDMLNFLFFRKGSGKKLSTTFLNMIF